MAGAAVRNVPEHRSGPRRSERSAYLGSLGCDWGVITTPTSGSLVLVELRGVAPAAAHRYP